MFRDILDAARRGNAVNETPCGGSLPPEAKITIAEIVEASNQSGSKIVVFPLRQDLHVGDVLHIAGVQAYSRILHIVQDWDREFVVTREAKKGDTLICLYPPIYDREPPPEEEESWWRTVSRLPRRGDLIQINRSA